MATHLRILSLLLSGLIAMPCVADTIMVDDFTTNLTFRNQNGSGTDGVFGTEVAEYLPAPDYQINLGETNTATWQDTGSGIISGTRKAFMSITSVPNSGAYSIIKDGLMSVNPDVDTKLASLKLTYNMPSPQKIDISNFSYFVIHFESFDSSTQGQLRVAVTMSDAAHTATSYFNNPTLVTGDNRFDLRGTPVMTAIDYSQVQSMSIDISSTVTGTEFRIDSFSFAPVPEASMPVALGTGIAGFFTVRKIRRNRRKVVGAVT